MEGKGQNFDGTGNWIWIKTGTGGKDDVLVPWICARFLPELCESLVELRKLLHGQFPLAVGLLQLLRLRPQLLRGLQNVLTTNMKNT